MKNISLFKLSAVIAAFLFSQPLFSQTGQAVTLQKSSGYAPVNGLKIYYEIYGHGKPLILLHGAYMNIGMNWSQLLPALSENRKVIAIEMQGHGRTADIDRPFSLDALSNDIAGVIKYLKIDSADVIGYSLGGTVALNLAIQNPAMVKKLIVISSAYKSEGWLPAIRSAFQNFKPEFFDASPLKSEYDSIAPNPKGWHAFVAKMIEFTKKEYNLGEAKIKAIQSPVLLIMGDNDGIDMQHKADFYKLLGGDVSADMTGLPTSQLAIIPGSTHVSLMMATNNILTIVKPFLGL